MIRVENLHLHYGTRALLRGVSFDVQPGETLAVIGESGSGKTSLARLLLGLLPGIYTRHRAHRSGFYWHGSAYVDEIDVLCARTADLKRLRGRGTGLIVQELADALNPALTIDQHLREVLAPHADIGKAYRDWNIPSHIGHRFPAGLSGGEIQRVLSALALLPAPRNLILDEPTASLDHQNRQRAIAAFGRDRATRSQLLITHDLDLARQISDRTAILQAGRIAEVGATKDILRAPSSSSAKSLLRAEQELKQARPVPIMASVSPPSKIEHGLRVQNLVHNHGNRRVLDGLSFFVPEGTCLAVMGESGSGKSTLARLLAGYETWQSGRITWNGADVPGSVRAALVSQHPHRAMPRHFTVNNVLEEALSLAGRRSGEPIVAAQCNSGQIENLLGLVGLPSTADFLHRLTAALSGGEAQRLAIARALAAKPHYIVLDEPTAALDAIARTAMVQLFRRLRDQRRLTIVLFTHEPEIANYLAHAFIDLSQHRAKAS